MYLSIDKRELVLQAEREVKPPTGNLIWIMPTEGHSCACHKVQDDLNKILHWGIARSVIPLVF